MVNTINKLVMPRKERNSIEARSQTVANYFRRNIKADAFRSSKAEQFES